MAALEEERQSYVDLGRPGGFSREVVETLLNLDLDKINYDLMEKVLEKICLSGEEGAVLVFMPGLMEIQKVHEACKGNSYIMRATSNGQYLIGLHSSLSSAEQVRTEYDISATYQLEPVKAPQSST